jgi:cell division protein ZapA (FtsZ GTPase activity inhibitor)
MIDEKFLIAAVNIRKNYIRLTSNVDFYRKRTEKTLEVLDSSLKELERIEKDMKDRNKNSDSINSIISVLTKIEEEGDKIEKFIDPLNKEIEKLAIEEQELYRIIVEKHPQLSENQIVESVRKRLEKEHLS